MLIENKKRLSLDGNTEVITTLAIPATQCFIALNFSVLRKKLKEMKKRCFRFSSDPDLEPDIQFHDKPIDNRDWYLMVGPEESDAPLYVRQNVYILDVHPKARDVLEIPEFEGLKPFLYVLDGEIEVKELTIGKQEAVNDFENALPALTANADSAVVLFYGCFDVYERNNQWVREKIKLDRKHPI